MSGNQIFSGAIEEISGIKWVNVTQDKYIFKTNNKHAMKTSEDVVLVFLLLFLTGIYLLLNKCWHPLGLHRFFLYEIQSIKLGGSTSPASIYMFKFNNRNRKRCEICSNLAIKTPERRLYGVFTVNFEHISHLFLPFLLLTLNR